MTDPSARWFQRALEALIERPTSTKLDQARYTPHSLPSSTRRRSTRAQRIRVRKAQHLARRKQR